jgi:hypothetical protein
VALGPDTLRAAESEAEANAILDGLGVVAVPLPGNLTVPLAGRPAADLVGAAAADRVGAAAVDGAGYGNRTRASWSNSR